MTRDLVPFSASKRRSLGVGPRTADPAELRSVFGLPDIPSKVIQASPHSYRLGVSPLFDRASKLR